ncbi:MAG: AAC(3) family N-acetyltransferase [Armatimonadetes bacterium]|nr:AAC(3) family N-acetyltransferase [Armatimonadota bacterium]
MTSNPGSPLVTRALIVEKLRSAGVTPGDRLVAHSSLSSFGRVEGGAEAVAQALAEAVQPGGLCVVPTFNYGQHPYDPLTTPSLTGAITEAFRKLPGAVRSLHPTHPVAAVGEGAAGLLEGHENSHAFGRGSPLWRLWEEDGWVLLIGCGNLSNSTIHVAEEVAAVPYLDRVREAVVCRGNQMERLQVRRPGCSRGFGKLDDALDARGSVRYSQIGNAEVRLMKSRDLVAVALEMLAKDSAALLCDISDCEVCQQAREMIRRSA